MNQTERRYFLIKELLGEQPEYRKMRIPQDTTGQKRLLRSLMNVRMPGTATQEFLAVQDAYLQEETVEKEIVELEELEPMQEGIYLWQGDITRLRCDAVVNAANSGMTGCYAPCHGCIDNCIHTFSGIQLRLACAELMEKQGHKEETGKAKITPGFNLPCRYVIHTVGPIVSGRLTDKHRELLASCYHSCMELAEENSLESIAFCCISTGEFHFPNDTAAQIAVRTVKEFMQKKSGIKKLIFNVFKDIDKQIYENLLI